ncbi:Membrane-bound lytic murein transglycosylase C [Commensalibacter sp. Nvir]|uniref:transglycosylase SLT domain-containing protein n=1 Tax=Commensalibacter sp. Nvir TaxID=3069817 RepID=UPI002D482D66|nr:Membrane-bound lytic murein transglycosylase C [Commensalibacter sp. Nvir]
MQGIQFISPLAVRALVAGATLFAGVSFFSVKAQTTKRTDQYEESSLVSSTSSSTSLDDKIRFPKPLSFEDEQRIRHIFDLQKQGDFTTAQSETVQLSDNLLLGDILAERYLNPHYTASKGQLILWLKNFPNYVEAPLILKKINHRNINTDLNFSSTSQDRFFKECQKISITPISLSSPFKRNSNLDRKVHIESKRGIKGAKAALSLIKSSPKISELYALQLEAEVAQQLFYVQENQLALDIAKQSFIHSKNRIALSGYIAGLICWENNDNDQAYEFFSKASRADVTSTEIQTASYFWAARTRIKVGDEKNYKLWLEKAATAPRTFYGILARHILEIDFQIPENNYKKINTSKTLSEEELQIINDTPFGKRFFALLQVGERNKAEIVLRQLYEQSAQNTAFSQTLRQLALAANFQQLANQFTVILQKKNQEAAHYKTLPIPKLTPRNGYKINPALVYALTRLESNFNQKATSHTGAMGLMQIMPVTARYIAKKQNNLILPRVNELKNPAINLEIGQLYLIHLSGLYNENKTEMFPKGGSLLHMLASYNAGPTLISKWIETNHNAHDPLLFMETIPLKETKNYLHKAITYLWIYSEELHVPAPSLQALADNQWPSFARELN